MRIEDREALKVEARKLYLDLNRLCCSLRDAGASDDTRLAAGQALGHAATVWGRLDRGED